MSKEFTIVQSVDLSAVVGGHQFTRSTTVDHGGGDVRSWVTTEKGDGKRTNKATQVFKGKSRSTTFVEPGHKH
jgi:hypothetical protein